MYQKRKTTKYDAEAKFMPIFVQLILDRLYHVVRYLIFAIGYEMGVPVYTEDLEVFCRRLNLLEKLQDNLLKANVPVCKYPQSYWITTLLNVLHAYLADVVVTWLV